MDTICPYLDYFLLGSPEGTCSTECSPSTPGPPSTPRGLIGWVIPGAPVPGICVVPDDVGGCSVPDLGGSWVPGATPGPGWVRPIKDHWPLHPSHE